MVAKNSNPTPFLILSLSSLALFFFNHVLAHFERQTNRMRKLKNGNGKIRQGVITAAFYGKITRETRDILKVSERNQQINGIQS